MCIWVRKCLSCFKSVGLERFWSYSGQSCQGLRGGWHGGTVCEGSSGSTRTLREARHKSFGEPESERRFLTWGVWGWEGL